MVIVGTAYVLKCFKDNHVHWKKHDTWWTYSHSPHLPHSLDPRGTRQGEPSWGLVDARSRLGKFRLKMRARDKVEFLRGWSKSSRFQKGILQKTCGGRVEDRDNQRHRIWLNQTAGSCHGWPWPWTHLHQSHHLSMLWVSTEAIFEKSPNKMWS